MGAAKDGDYIRVTIEGTAQANGTYTLVHGEGGSWLAEFKDRHVGNGITVEKIEPPVEVFKPGDVVRDKYEREWFYILTVDGYTELPKGVHYNDGEPPTHFTSKEYERVTLE